MADNEEKEHSAEGVERAVSAFAGELETFKKANAEAVNAVKKTADASAADAKEAAKQAEAAIERADKAASALLDIEQRVAEFVGKEGRGTQAMSVGQIVAASKAYKDLALAPGQTPEAGFKLRVEANTLTGQTGSPPENDDTLVPPARRAGIIPGAFRALRVADLLTTIPISSNAWDFVRETTWTNNAAETAEATAKPESELGFTLMTVNIRTIAHFIKASNQILADAPALRAYIDRRLIYGVNYRLDSQLINGTGTGQNISGMVASGNYTAGPTPLSGETAIDTLNRAKYALIGAEWAADGIIMNPADWGTIERLKTTDSAYLVGNPFGGITPMLWGLPVALTNAIASGKYIMADFATSYDHLARQSMAVDLGYVNDDFTKNLVTIRAERRDALATVRPASTRYGDLTA